jgi:hypothetical protein
MPNVIGLFMDKEKLPSLLKDDPTGHKVWGAIISVNNNMF